MLLYLCVCPCILTLGLLTLAWGLPANAGAMLIQVEESHQPFGSCLQLYHLCPGLHHTHASLHCRRKNTQTQTLRSVERHIKTQREQVSGFVCLFSGRSEAKCHSIAQLVEQPAADVGQSPNCNRDATVWTHRAAFLLPTDLLLKAMERRKKERDLIERDRANVCLSVLSFPRRACRLFKKKSWWGRWKLHLGYIEGSPKRSKTIYEYWFTQITKSNILCYLPLQIVLVLYAWVLEISFSVNSSSPVFNLHWNMTFQVFLKRLFRISALSGGDLWIFLSNGEIDFGKKCWIEQISQNLHILIQNYLRG